MQIILYSYSLEFIFFFLTHSIRPFPYLLSRIFTSSFPLSFPFIFTDTRSLEGIVDKLRSDELVDGVATQNLTVGDSDDEHQKFNPLPGILSLMPCLISSCLVMTCRIVYYPVMPSPALTVILSFRHFSALQNRTAFVSIPPSQYLHHIHAVHSCLQLPFHLLLLLSASIVCAGAKGRNAGKDGSRTTRPTIYTSTIRFSPTGREWAAATSQVCAPTLDPFAVKSDYPPSKIYFEVHCCILRRFFFLIFCSTIRML